jgi:hypothetical protein
MAEWQLHICGSFIANYTAAFFLSFFFTVVPCILISLKSFIYQLVHNIRSCFKIILKFTLKQFLHVSV